MRYLEHSGTTHPNIWGHGRLPPCLCSSLPFLSPGPTQLDPHLPEAFAVLGFAFYMQPMLMPVLKEMPKGPGGVAVSERAVHVVLYLVACLAYGTVGVFGASIFGQQVPILQAAEQDIHLTTPS